MQKTGDFGSLVRQMRLARNLEQKDLATRAHFTQSYISRVERGLRRPSTPRHVHNLALGLAAGQDDAEALYRAAGFLPLSDALHTEVNQVDGEAAREEPYKLAEDFIAGRAAREWPPMSEQAGDLPSRRTELHDREGLLRTAISLVNEIPPRKVRAGQDAAVACSFQSADLFRQLPELRNEWQAALVTALFRKWNIHHLVRLDQSAESALAYVEEMLALVGSEAQGTYEPRYLAEQQARSQPHSILIVPRKGAMQFFSEPPSVEPAYGCFYPSDEGRPYPIAPLRDQFAWFWSQAVPLARTYSLTSTAGSFAYYDAVRNAAEQDGDWNFVADGPSERTFPAVVDRQRLAHVIRLGGEKARIARAYVNIRHSRRQSFLRQIGRFRYREICPRSYFERLLGSGELGWDSLQRFGAPPETIEQKIIHLRQIVSDLVRYDNYELGLLTEEQARRYCSTRWMMKEGYSVCIRVSRPNAVGRPVNLGIELRHPGIVEAFALYSGHIWESMEPPNRDKRQTIAWLKQLIDALESRAKSAQPSR